MTALKNIIRNLKALSSNNLIVACVPLLGYLLAYTYQSGYLDFYDIPSTFIQIDLVRVVKASLAVAFALVLLFILINVTKELLSHSHPFWKVIGKAFSIGIFLGLIFLLDISTTETDIKQIGIIVSAFILLTLVPPLFKWHSGKTYWEKVSIELETEAAENANEKGASTISNIIGLALLLIYAFMFVKSLGMREAKNQTEWWVLKDRPEMLMVAAYGDTVILKKINLISKEITDELEVMKMSDTTPLRITLVSLGELNTKSLKESKKRHTQP